MQVNIPGFGIGWIIALLVLVVCLVIWLAGHALSDDLILALIAALAVARLVP